MHTLSFIERFEPPLLSLLFFDRWRLPLLSLPLLTVLLLDDERRLRDLRLLERLFLDDDLRKLNL
jgi:hypothetical protein